MSVYFIRAQTVTDLDGCRKEYIPRALPFIAKDGDEVVVVCFDEK